ncbi:unnamed protein product, partial [Iphiclides podalirius]
MSPTPAAETGGPSESGYKSGRAEGASFSRQAIDTTTTQRAGAVLCHGDLYGRSADDELATISTPASSARD